MLVIIGLITTSCSKNINNQNSFEINKNWVFKSINDSLWDKAEVPGCIHTDLIANGKIDDPFYRMNEHDIQWIDKKDWEYKTTFLVDENTLNKDEVEITFHGLDTYANVYLNDSLILKADNMFIKWNVKCKQDLKKGENSLRIVFESPIKIGLEKRDSLDFVFPDPPNDFSQIGGLGDKKVSLFSRKAGYHFGWDWGPRLVSSGIWDKIEIAAWNKARLTDVNIIQHELNNNNAKLSSNIEIESIAKSEVTVTGYLDSENIFEKVFPIKEGNNHFKIPFSISKPELWWTNGLGDQKLYNIVVEIKDSSGLLSSKNLNIGLRTLEVIQEPDSIGKSFYFKLNGHPVFMKGANYIPQDVFLNRVNQDEYERVIQSAVDANYNMLRVWGGGIYERDIFYDLCDKFGILVWQDFMFACSMYPGDDKFLESVKIEATQNVKRLRNHPSIAIWCGDNENLSAWNNWGWKDQIFEKYGQGVVDKIWKAYDDIFHSILPNVVNDLDPQRLYWSSSPSAGFGQVENGKSGDMHYWGVWWGKEPFSKYNEIIPRFMSEFGFQSFPQFESIKKFSRKEDWDINSEVMKSHQRSSIGNVTIEEYLLRDYRKPKDFEKFLYVGQLLQAEGIKLGIHAHRQNMPYCMGSLYWQINDCWPVASWSSTDYYGNWKALHYRVRDAFKDIILSTKTSNDDLNIYVISDKLKNIDAKISLELINFDGQILNSWENKIIVEANKSKVYLSESIDSITLGKNLEETLLRIKLISSSQNILDSYNHYFVKPKNLNIPKSNVDVKIKKLRNQNFSIVLSSDKLAKNVYLSSSITGFFSDNYIDIFPDEILEINFQTNDKISIDSLKNDLKVISLIDTY